MNGPGLFEGGTSTERAIPLIDWEERDGKIVRVLLAPGMPRPLIARFVGAMKAEGCEVVEATEEQAAE